MSIIQNLKKNVKYIRMRLLHLIKQDNRIRIAANLFAELSALLIAHISWGRTNHLGDAVLLHIFGHIYPNQSILCSKHGLCQSLAKLCLSNSGWSKE